MVRTVLALLGFALAVFLLSYVILFGIIDPSICSFFENPIYCVLHTSLRDYWRARFLAIAILAVLTLVAVVVRFLRSRDSN